MKFVNMEFLYYLTEKESSSLAIIYLNEHKKSKIRVKAEGKVTYTVLPSKIVYLWFQKYSSWRDYYFKLNQKQISLII